MPGRVVIIGGGFAGFRAAVSLVDAGCVVTLVDNRAQLGGRARSFPDPATGELVDNGQHLFLSGYERTLAFLERLGTRDQVVFQDRLRVKFAEAGGKQYHLDCPNLPAPFHLIGGLLGLSSIPFVDKLRLVQMWREIRQPHLNPLGTPSPEAGEGRGEVSFPDESVARWLSRMGQGPRARKLFWDPLTIAALNELPEAASAIGLTEVLRVLMTKPAAQSRLGMARVGLSQLYAEPAARLISESGGKVISGKTVQSLAVGSGKIDAVVLADGTRIEADAVIAAIPPMALRKLLEQSALGGQTLLGQKGSDPIEKSPVIPSKEGIHNLSRFGSSPILSVNLWIEPIEGLPAEPFVAMIGTEFQWLFKKAGYFSLILSAAHHLLDYTNEQLAELALSDLKACFPSMPEICLIRSQVVREREATVSLGVGAESLRPGPKTGLPNFFLAGDWTATGLPATIESAVLSGEFSAELLLLSLRGDPSSC